MRVGDVVAERFVLEAIAGRGGMGTVYRAKDKQSGDVVALKTLRGAGAENRARFAREAIVLSMLEHPAIVRYVAHGSAARSHYLVMGWVEGESLEARLRREPLTAQQSLALVRRLALALGVAHAAGVLHRDLKPANVILENGEPGRAVLLDFGVARRRVEQQGLTVTGALVGTAAYMAPEQVLARPDIDARADVFALGGLLYRCLTGVKPFVGDSTTAILAKILLEDPPSPATVRPEIGADIDAFVMRCLAKDPAARPEDGAAVAAGIAALGHADLAAPAPTSRTSLTESEQRVVAVMLVSGLSRARREASSTSTLADATDTVVESPSAVVRTKKRAPSRERLVRDLVEARGATMEMLQNGRAVITLADTGAAHDHAYRVARCALALRETVPTVAITITMGYGVLSQTGTIAGEVVGRASRDNDDARKGRIFVDEPTSRLLGSRFALTPRKRFYELEAEREGDPARRLLGRETPCVGRARELATLESLFDEAREESVARVALVTCPSGGGKSRLRYELLRRLRARGAQFELLFGRADSLGAGSPYGPLADALRKAAGLAEGEADADRRAKLEARLACLGTDAAADRSRAFLGELLGSSPLDSAEVNAARRDPMLMGDATRAALEAWLGAECTRRPVILVLEDLHWGDVPTVRLVDQALRNLSDRPLLVLALARPEVHKVFPELWTERNVLELRLAPLTRAAAESLVRETLGDASTEQVRGLVDAAQGNAFYLEELIRGHAEGADTAPTSVLAMVQARLAGFDPSARRVLRAASVFGDTFWEGGVAALLGTQIDKDDRATALGVLVDKELIARRVLGTFAREAEYVFRHSLVREAAYAMLTEKDRTLGHRLAGAWLEAAGESEPLHLAEHYVRGGALVEAAGWYGKAAERALLGNDFEAALGRAARAIEIAPDAQECGAWRLVQAEAHRWRGEHAEVVHRAEEARSLLPAATAPWFRATAELVAARANQGNYTEVRAVLQDAAEHDVSGEARDAQMTCLCRGTVHLFQGGHEAAIELDERVEALAEHGQVEALAAHGHALAARPAAWLAVLRSQRALHAGERAEYLRAAEVCVAAFDALGDARNGCLQRVNLAYAHAALGDYPRARTLLVDGLEAAERLGLPNPTAWTLHNLGPVLAAQGELEAAATYESRAVAMGIKLRQPRLEGASRAYLAAIILQAGDLVTADAEARRATELLLVAPPMRGIALAVLAQVRLARGDAPGALEAAREAMDLLEQLGRLEEGEALVRLAYAEALAATGATAQAHAAIHEARAKLLTTAEPIRDPEMRARFLEHVAEHAATLRLAAALP